VRPSAAGLIKTFFTNSFSDFRFLKFFLVLGFLGFNLQSRTKITTLEQRFGMVIAIHI